MTTARAALVDALENGGREVAADKAAVAQARFDCWAEQQEESWNANVPCKNQFYDALKALQALVGERPAAPPAEDFMAPVGEVSQGEAVPVDQAMFIVFFDWDKHNISAGANDVLDAVAQEVTNRKDVKGIVIVGHTDSSGSTAYNDKLSMKRANAIRDGLVSRGVAADMIRVEARGESELLVKTADNVREPANRRGQITLE
jgi:OOP family OmpA-OmpF porin